MNREREEWEEAMAGWWMLRTDTELWGPEVVKVYQSLAVVERAFQMIKGPSRVRLVHPHHGRR
ncbi:MAG: hypothetical protein ACYDFT_07685, partial [Thermoplasmata archaeon]